MRRRQFIARAATAAFAGALPARIRALAQSRPPVHVILWFDTEDYILPASDDAALRVADLLTRLGVKATFKVVGEKARVLEQRGRLDVIAALKKHEIGYHSNLHSGEPTPAVYLQHAGWDDGSAEFFRREAPGVRDLERIFGVTPVCYGQPGSSWAPQSYPALRRMGVSMYLDEADHVGVDDQPFYYGGMLNVFRMRANVVRMALGRPDNLADAEQRFVAAITRLRGRGGGTVSIYYHPCEFVHREFWDGVNFGRGANPPRSEWKLPPMQTAAEIERNFQQFEQYVRFMQRQENVRFVQCADLMTLYEDRARRYVFTRNDIESLASAVQDEIGYRSHQNFTLSGSDMFSLLTEAFLSWWDNRSEPLTWASIDGPARPFSASAGGSRPTMARLGEWADVVRDVSGYLRARGRMPDDVWLGAYNLSPQDYLATLGAVMTAWRGRDPSGVVPLRTGRFVSDRHVAEDSTGLWSWVIFPEGFRAPAIMEQARLQAWTLKPALPTA